MAYHSVNLRACYAFPVTRFAESQFQGIRQSRVYLNEILGPVAGSYDRKDVNPMTPFGDLNRLYHQHASTSTSTQNIKCLVIKTWHLKITVFWAVESCSVVEVYQRFGGTCYLHHERDPKTIIFILAAMWSSNVTRHGISLQIFLSPWYSLKLL